MTIEVRLYASLGRYLPPEAEGNSCILEIEPETTVRDVLRNLNVPLDSPKVIFLNGVHADGGEVLKDGDRVGVFPPVAGG
ncbi:MAG TPA: MoaD/ThiS family protein [Thermodesulfobacteriota bacterium]|nr:MoaD/ThiS family protein [Thermodesulfobacteriota bacterium]